ncbi:hypothetical protein SSX86_001347 [Deinandra increscens subsp. villosa]|uniref:NLP1-9 GAF domain-containing protein n=1 Tax=Deinandra increscens subsp. villosa TaxID=3103831 RepID=A0AAP0DYV0_9ASTR
MGENPWPEINPARRGAWWGSEESDEINNKIQLAFNNVKSFPLKRIILQLWKPAITANGRRFLSCPALPLALSPCNHLLWKYRRGCANYFYSLDGLGDPVTIIGAPASTAALNQFPEVVLDLKNHRGTPLVDLALECELTCSIMLPVFNQVNCEGVVEISSRRVADLAVIFNALNLELTKLGLRITPPQSLWLPCKRIKGYVRPAAREIETALSVAIESHAITLGQVWYAYENLNPVLKIRRRLLAKLRSFSQDGNDHLSYVKLFYDNLRVVPLKTNEGLLGRALDNRLPYLCRNIYKLSGNRGGMLALLSANAKSYACFVICLRSSHSGELDYAFEFFWPHSRNHLALVKELLLTLREHLPSFTYLSGGKLGDELLVVDADNSSSGNGDVGGSESTIEIFPGNQVSKRPSRGTKRNFSDFHDRNKNSLTNSNQEDEEEEEDDDDDLVILAVYNVDERLFYLPRSATFEDVMDKIKLEFEHELDPVGTYKVEYQVVPGKWYGLTDDTSLKSCISSSKNTDYIKFYVLPVEG